MFSARQLRIAFKTICLQRLGHIYPNQTHIHPIRVRAFASTPRDGGAEVTENLTEESPLLQQLVTNPKAILALKEFRQFMMEQGINLSPDRPPSTMQLMGIMVNPTFRKGLQKLQGDLANAGVNINSENAMEMWKAFKGQDTNSK